MKKHLLLGGLLIILFMACQSQKEKKEDMNETFSRFTESLIKDFMKLNPGWALSIGLHDYDDVLEINDAERRQQKLSQYQSWQDSLNRFPDSLLNESHRMDKAMLLNYFAYYKWQTDTFRSYEWNPAEYNVGEGFDLVLNNTNAPLNQKLEWVHKRLQQVPAYYANAVQQISNPTKEHIQLAIVQNEGSKYIFKELIPDSLSQSTLTDSLKASISNALSQALHSIDDYVSHLRTTESKLSVASTPARNFRIGKDLFEQKFKYEIYSSYTAEQIYHIAMQRKTEIQDSMYKLSRELWPKYFGKKPMPENRLSAIAMMIETLSLSHCQRDSFLQTIQKQIPELEKFINEKQLLYLGPSKPLVVRQTPPYMEGGGAGASINDPGPFNKNGKTYYNVSLLTNYTPQQAESYLSEYNDYILQILNIHEAIPGHYTQLVYANQSPSLVKSIFGNGAMVEGWAVYGERMMLEEGYGNFAPELWLMYYKWHLRSVMNTILDYSIQCLNMSEAEAKRLMTQEAFQQQAEADGKWKRATLTQVQLCSYFTGFTEIYALREQLKKVQGASFSLKKFHEQFLSYGSAPVPLIAEVILAKQ